MSDRCEMCGTPVDEGDYQDDGYRHTDGRCTEYLKAALGAANLEAVGLRDALARAQNLWTQEMRVIQEIRNVLENYENDEHLRADTALGAIDELVNP